MFRWLGGLIDSNERLFFDLTPLIPLSLRRRGGRERREGQSPSLTHTPPSLVKGRGSGDRLLSDLYRHLTRI